MPEGRPITVYTSPGCPDCGAVKAWLDKHGLSYQERDISDPANLEEARRRFGVRIAPITAIGEEYIYGTFEHQRPELERLLG